MRIIFLNAWHGKAWLKLQKFILKESRQTDIFCFSEVNPPLSERISENLSGYRILLEKLIRVNYLGGVTEGQTIILKDSSDVLSSGKEFTYEVSPNDAGCLQYANISLNGTDFWIGNIHGMAQPAHKLDIPERIAQSQRIINFFSDKRGPKIIGGDFNLMPQTRSVTMFKEAGYRNLISEFEIKDTRGKLNHRQFKKNDLQMFADYVFVTPDVKVKNFQVPDVEISDHLPLILDFEI